MRRLIPDPRESDEAHESNRGDQIPLRPWLAGLRAGTPTLLDELELTPLLHDGPRGEPVMLMHEALRSGALEIVEQGSGVVNELVAHNRGQQAVLVLEGESVVGAKQNRVVTLDVLIAAGTTVAIPVGCVEQGRWGHVSSKFDSAGSMMEPMMRAGTVQEMSEHGALDQGRLWSEVSAKLAACGVESGTRDYHALVKEKLGEAKARANSVAVLPDQVGVLATRVGCLVGFDVVAHPLTWSALAERLIMSYAFAAMGKRRAVAHAGGGTYAPAGRGAEESLRNIVNARIEARPALGLGAQVTLAGDGVTGGGLWHELAPAHLAVFGVENHPEPRRAPRERPH